MKIRLLAMDVDGTLTDGKIYMGPEGETMKAFDIKDGYGIVRFREAGGIPAIITGRRSKIVEQRCRELGIMELHQGVQDKLRCLAEISQKYGLEPKQIAYVGDDLNDLPCLGYAGLAACPADAVTEVKETASFVSKNNGGRGAVRELIDRIMTSPDD